MDSEATAAGQEVQLDRIMELIPHRYPFLLIDAVTDMDPGERAVGIKNVTINEPFFQGHFPDHPIMPGVLIVEAMAQTAAVVVLGSLGDAEGSVVYFMSIEGARFRKPVLPGDRLMLHVTKQHGRGNVWKFKGEARVGGQLKAEATYTAMIVKNP